MSRRFSGTAAHIGTLTVDGRGVRALTHRDLPIPVTMRKSDPDHDGSWVVGFIDSVVGHGNEPGPVAVGGDITEEWALQTLGDGEGWFLQAEMDDVTITSGLFDAEQWMDRARLSGVHLGRNPAWPDTHLVLAEVKTGDF